MFSVIIPSCNRSLLLKKCLDALHPEFQQPAVIYEVIVSDDSTNEDTRLLLTYNYSWVKYTKGVRNGIGANRNNGAKLAKGEWLIFIDDDAVPALNILSCYKSAIIKNPNSKAFEGCILPDNEDLMKNNNAECPVNIDGGHFWTANVCINKSLFEHIKGFDENLKFFHEDQDIFRRLKNFTQIPFVKDSIVVHPVTITSLKKKIIKAKKAYTDYITFERKSKSSLTIFLVSYKFHLTSIKMNLLNRKYDNILLSMYHIFWLIPINNIKSLKSIF